MVVVGTFYIYDAWEGGRDAREVVVTIDSARRTARHLVQIGILLIPVSLLVGRTAPCLAACDCAAKNPGSASSLRAVVAAEASPLLAMTPRYSPSAVFAAATQNMETPPLSYGRIAGEFGASAVGSFLSLWPAFFIWGSGFECNGSNCAVMAFGGGLAMYAAGSTLGPWIVGNLGDQSVPIKYPLLGAMAGAGAGYALLLGGDNFGGVAIVAGFGLVPVGATIGAVLGRRYDKPKDGKAGAALQVLRMAGGSPLGGLGSGARIELVRLAF